MSMSDPLADMLTRIRNANKARFPSVDIPSSQLKLNVANVLKKEGFISDFLVKGEGYQQILTLMLKYGPKNELVINGIRRVSKPGHRQYKRSNHLPKVMSGLGITILTTSRGVITDKQAQELNVGGELLCEVW